MNSKTKNNVLNTISIIFLVYAIFSFFVSIYIKQPDRLFWFCYIVIFLSGIAIYKRNSLLLVSQINILFLYTLIWDIDFIYEFITGKILWNVSHYFFLYTDVLQKIVSLQHLIYLPLSFYALYLLKVSSKDAWRISLVQITLVYILTRFLTDPHNNLNCVFSSCAKFIIYNNLYTINWFFAMFASAIVINFAILEIKIFRKNS